MALYDPPAMRSALWDRATPVDVTLACLHASCSFLSQTTPAGRHHLPNGPILSVSSRVPSSPGETGRPSRCWTRRENGIATVQASLTGWWRGQIHQYCVGVVTSRLLISYWPSITYSLYFYPYIWLVARLSRCQCSYESNASKQGVIGSLGPQFLGEYIPNFEHAVWNLAHFWTCGKFCLLSEFRG